MERVEEVRPGTTPVRDRVGRVWENAGFFIASCPHCGARMWTESLLGKLKFNEHGWGVWEAPHAEGCTLERADEARWIRVSKETYDAWRKGQEL